MHSRKDRRPRWGMGIHWGRALNRMQLGFLEAWNWQEFEFDGQEME
tara:strand:+ start:134 stop:271 length:138 start_codon:yes stop_codon:yes gene_type:complete